MSRCDVCVLFQEIRSDGAHITQQNSPSSLKRFKLINIFSPLNVEDKSFFTSPNDTTLPTHPSYFQVSQVSEQEDPH